MQHLELITPSGGSLHRCTSEFWSLTDSRGCGIRTAEKSGLEINLRGGIGVKVIFKTGL